MQTSVERAIDAAERTAGRGGLECQVTPSSPHGKRGLLPTKNGPAVLGRCLEVILR